MKSDHVRIASSFSTLFLLGTLGCGTGPGRVQAPSISASGAGSAAIDQYDINGDGLVGGDELDAAPSLKAAMSTLDTDSDGQVSADEVSARVNAWQDQKVGIMTVKCMVTLNGQPVDDAEVVFEPEAFLGDAVQAGSGTTNRYGLATPVIPVEKRPSPDTPPGLALGLYKVRITKGTSIPARYNTETILGQQLAIDEPSLVNNVAKFELTSK